MATYTTRQVIEKVMSENLSSIMYNMSDAVDALGNEKIEVVEASSISRYHRADTSVITVLNSDGTVASASKASYAAGTFASDVYSTGAPYILQLSIGRDKFHVYGIDGESLDKDYNGMEFSPMLKADIDLLVKRFYSFRRDQVCTMLKELGASADSACLPLGKQVVANSRTTYWNFDNQLAAALSESSLADAQDAACAQFDADGLPVGNPAIRYLLHATKFTLANQILSPDMVINAQYKSIADFKGPMTGFKMAGSYGDTSAANDWVAIFDNHSIKRICFTGYELPKPRITYDQINKQLILEVADWSLMSIDSPVGVVKAIVS